MATPNHFPDPNYAQFAQMIPTHGGGGVAECGLPSPATGIPSKRAGGAFTKDGFWSATRIHGSFLAAAEKRTLIWLARHTPGFINSDHLTALGLLAMLGAGASYWLARWNPAALVLVS